MITIKPSLLLAAALLLAFAGCTTTNPNAAFNQLGETVADRTGERLRWLRDGPENEEIARAIEALLHTNLTAQSTVAITLLNNCALQAEFEELGISQADLAQASRLRNPSFSGFARLPTRRPT